VLLQDGVKRVLRFLRLDAVLGKDVVELAHGGP
jgi:hypothetical protein